MLYFFNQTTRLNVSHVFRFLFPLNMAQVHGRNEVGVARRKQDHVTDLEKKRDCCVTLGKAPADILCLERTENPREPTIQGKVEQE